ncbi:MAG: hypothetical protein ACREHD_13960, partial [Pirellulales bacterium]
MAAFWNSSRAHESTTGWAPRWLSAYYWRASAETAKPDQASMPWAFFNVYFTPATRDEPVAVWGHLAFA